jgi:hypothetical protein
MVKKFLKSVNIIPLLHIEVRPSDFIPLFEFHRNFFQIEHSEKMKSSTSARFDLRQVRPLQDFLLDIGICQNG